MEAYHIQFKCLRTKRIITICVFNSIAHRPINTYCNLSGEDRKMHVAHALKLPSSIISKCNGGNRYRCN